MERKVVLLVLVSLVPWVLVTAETDTPNKTETKGFLLTGPKNLLIGSTETFCISLEDDQQLPLCSLDLLSRDADTVHASVQHQLTGGSTFLQALQAIC